MMYFHTTVVKTSSEVWVTTATKINKVILHYQIRYNVSLTSARFQYVDLDYLEDGKHNELKCGFEYKDRIRYNHYHLEEIDKLPKKYKDALEFLKNKAYEFDINSVIVLQELSGFEKGIYDSNGILLKAFG